MNKFKLFRDQIMEELFLVNTSNNATKDILIVVHDQLPYVKKCIESVINNTQNFILHLWDNASNYQTKEYLDIFTPARSETNQGFIIPNNRLAEQSTADYLILLNSDCEVRSGWDLAMINHLETHHDCAQVGYCGAKLDENGHGKDAVFGHDADFICGWCMCLSRKTYQEFGLFDEINLEFAYGEDSDLSLRLRESGKKIYSLHNDLVIHHGNKTILEVHQEKGHSLKETFDHNHQYIRKRWSKYLPKEFNGEKN